MPLRTCMHAVSVAAIALQTGINRAYSSAKRSGLFVDASAARGQCLREEGAKLAEGGNYWEAVRCWDQALALTPHSPQLHEMKAQVSATSLFFTAGLPALLLHCWTWIQVLLELDQVWPAVQSAECAVAVEPTWAVALQTLGRAQLAMGEIHLVR